MRWTDRLRLIPFDYVILLPVMALAFYVANIPHLNYPYPLHLDEWAAIAQTNELFRAGDVTKLVDPFSGGPMLFWQFTELGFHLFWGAFQRISGISWITIARYFPGIMTMLATLAVYALSKRRGFGWEAAFFAALVPTSVGVLGPAFFVPVATALLFIPLAILLAFDFEGYGSLIVLFIFVTFLLITHAFTALAVAVALIPIILINLKGRWRRSLGLAAAVFVPFLMLVPWGLPYITQVSGYLLTPQYLSPVVDYPHLVQFFGYLPIALVILGAFYLAGRGQRKDYGLVLGLVAVLGIQVAFCGFHFGMGGVFERGFLYAMLLMSVVAGAGLSAVKNARLSDFFPSLRPRFLVKNTGLALCGVIVICTLATVIPPRLSANYYHMIDANDYEAFAWIAQNVGPEYDTALLDPWKATAFTAITGKKVFRRITMAPANEDKQVYDYLAGGCRDSSFLARNGISLVYSTSQVDNPDLVQVSQNVYLLRRNAPRPP